MEASPAWLLGAALALFAAFVVVKSLVALRSGGEAGAELRRRVGDAKRRARDPAAPASARAEAWREAARLALDEGRRPALAAVYALRAERAAPGDGESLGVIARVLRLASRYRALEKLLWRRLATDSGPAYDRAFDELVALYDGPLRRPDRASALRRLRGQATGS